MLLMFKIPIPQYIVDSLPHTIWLVLFHRIDLSLDVVLSLISSPETWRLSISKSVE